MGGIHYIPLKGDSLWGLPANDCGFFNYQGLLFALLDWYNQTLRFSFRENMRVVSTEKFNNQRIIVINIEISLQQHCDYTW